MPFQKNSIDWGGKADEHVVNEAKSNNFTFLQKLNYDKQRCLIWIDLCSAYLFQLKWNDMQ